MRCAMVAIGSNIVENVIVADPAVDPAPDGYSLIWVEEWINPGDPFDAPAPVEAVAAAPQAVAPTSPSSGVELL